MAPNKIYYKATLVAVLIILLNQCFIQYWLYQKREDAKLINIAGRQRMYSQKLVVQLYSYQAQPSKAELKALNELYSSWAESHQYLQEFYQSLDGIVAHDHIRKGLEALTPIIKYIEPIIQHPENLKSQDLLSFRENQQLFLTNMDRLVKSIEEESLLKLNLVVWIEIVFALISLGLIFYEIAYVFQRISHNLQQKNTALKASNEMLEGYAYLAAHDLRLPTQNIINFSKVLRKKLDDRMSEKEKEYFGFIQESTERLKNTTGDLLDFAKISGEKLDLDNFDPLALFNNILDDLQGTITEKQALIRIEDLPDSIEGDKSLLRLVFLNLISNSLKFVSDENFPMLNIQYEEAKNHHIFAIQDNGIGIPKEKQAQIFGLFKRLHNQQEFPGTGIGLSICQKVVEKHQGQIYLDSVDTQGSTFYVELPKGIAK